MKKDEELVSRRAKMREALAAAPEGFSLRELAASSGVTEAEFESFIDADSEYFRDDDRVRRREEVFSGRRFLITPEAWEIESGVLVPGHRFVPYLDPEVFPSEAQLRLGRRKVAVKEAEFPISRVIGAFALLGSSQMLDVLMAESPANGFLRTGIRGDSKVRLTVFDLAEFYREHDFEEGDALECVVSDYRKGAVRFGYLSGAKRSAARKKEFIAAFEEACAKAITRFGEFPDVPETLAWSFFFGGDKLDVPGASLDEFIRESSRIILASGDDGDSELRCAVEDEDDTDAGVPPEGLSISSGETGTLAAMLKATGAAVSPDELDGFILDACASRELDFANCYSRAFRGGGPEFADEAQEAVFMNFVEERFEELSGNYDRIDDELKAPLRSSIMEAVDDRLEFFSEAAAWEGGAKQLDADKLRALALAAGHLERMLKMLNREDFIPDAPEIERLEQELEIRLDEQDAALEALRSGILKE